MAEEVKTDDTQTQTGTQDQQQQTAKDDLKYTDKQVNDIVKARSDEKVSKLLKELGLENEGTLKEKIQKLKEYEDSQKTETEKLTEAQKEAIKKADEARAEADAMRAENAALKSGVDPAKVDKFVKIAMSYDGATVAEKVTAALAEFPEFKSSTAPAGAFSTGSKSQTSGTNDDIVAQMRKGLGVTKKA